MTRRIVLTAVIGGIALFAMAACSGQSASDSSAGLGGMAVPAEENAAGVDLPVDDRTQKVVPLPTDDLLPVVVNVWFDGSGVWPKHVSVPADRQVLLVLRNHDQEEHHYHILGMPTAGIRWRSREDGAASGVSPEEHALHHPEEHWVDYHICTSRSGICPTGEWVHAHANPADMDMISFIANTPGVYAVIDPLHPDLKAVFSVF